jgi:hypothetical protein
VLYLVPDATENRKLFEYLHQREHFESVSMKLQGSGEKRLTVFGTREILDQLIREHCEECKIHRPIIALRRRYVRYTNYITVWLFEVHHK